MNTIEQLEYLTELAQRVGYVVRYDYFGGTGGGVCEYGGKKHLFLDLALNSVEQLAVIQSALAADPLVATIQLPEPIRQSLSRAA